MLRSANTFKTVMPAVSLRGIHSRGYLNFDDNVSMIYHEINGALMGAKNTPNIAFIYKKFGED